MATKKIITAEEAGRIWFMHEKGLTNTEIVGITGRSVNSISRVLGVFRAVKHGDLEALNRPSFNNCVAIKAAAMKHFGMSATNADILSGRGLKPLNPEAEKTDSDLLSEVRRTNELLEQLITLWRD